MLIKNHYIQQSIRTKLRKRNIKKMRVKNIRLINDFHIILFPYTSIKNNINLDI